MAETEQDKSEQPTSFKLMNARRKGTVARSMDLGFMVGMAVLLLALHTGGSDFSASLAQAMRETFVSGAQADDNATMLGVIPPLLKYVVPSLTFMFVALFVSVLLFELVQTGVVMSFHPLKPDFSRLNPAAGLKRLFTLRLLLETAKNILKLCVYTLAGGYVIRNALRADVGSIVDAATLATFFLTLAIRLLGTFAFVALLFAIIDQILVRRTFLKSMRMSRRELKREVRDREGDARLKQKRKQLHSEFAKLSQSVNNLPGADVVVTNPDHIAIGLRYDGKTMTAPKIVSIGINGVALRLKRLAALYGIVVIENRPLARQLLKGGRLDQAIPDPCFEAVAAIYNDLRRAGRWAGAR